jgi:hypothetical protein
MSSTKNSPTTTPLRVYLDTSDYSKFADLGYRDVPGVQAVLDYLRKEKAQGRIEVRFSWVHLFEFLKNPDESPLALRKVQFIEELCGEAAFRYASDVFRIERESLGTDIALRQAVASDKGEWFPEIDTPPDMRSKLIQGLKLKFPSLSEAQLEAFMKEAIGAGVTSELSAQFPLAGVYESGVFEAFMDGTSSDQEFARGFMRGFAKPKILITHYLEGKVSARRLFDDLTAGERRIKDLIVHAREEMAQHYKKIGEAGHGIDEIRRYVRNLTMKSSADTNSVLLPTHVRESISKEKFAPELPALSIYSNLLSEYYRDILYPSSSFSTPVIKESDPGDIMHAVYLPFVDIYRTDGRFANLLAKIDKPGGIVVVPKLRQLPEIIEKELKKRTL